MRRVQASKTVFFIRHGQSEANCAIGKDMQDQRWLDSRLTSLGRKQASHWQGLAPQWDVDAILVSPLCRTMETASLVFGNIPDASFTLTPSAREGWFVH